MEVETITTERHSYLQNLLGATRSPYELFPRTGPDPFVINGLRDKSFEDTMRDSIKMLNAQASAEIVNQAKRAVMAVNGKKVKKSNVIPNEQTDLVDARPDVVCGSTKKSNTSQNEHEEFAQMETETTVDGSEKLSNDNGDTAVTEPKSIVNGSKVKSMPLKEQPDILCNCPLQCNSKLGIEWRKVLYRDFQGIADHTIQNSFIQRHMKIRRIDNGLRKDKVVVDRRTQKRVNCKYLVPISGTVKDSLSHAKRLSYDWAKSSPRLLRERGNANEFFNASKPSAEDDTTKEIQTDFSRTPSNTLPSLNGYHDAVPGTRKAETYDTSSPMSLNDSDSMNVSFDDGKSGSEEESRSVTPVNYIEVCQKAFVNTFGLTEKRIRWQREKLIFRAKSHDIKKQKEREESDRTLTLAHSLGVGCQPLYAAMDRANCLHLSNVLLDAIGEDVALINHFFKHQLWKPEYFMDGPLKEADSDLPETDCDEIAV